MKYNTILSQFDINHPIKNWETQKKIRVGSHIILGIQIQEGDKFRTQAFKGLVIAKKSNGYNKSIRVRKSFQKIGVERIFPLNSVQIQSVEVQQSLKKKVRRSKLYYFRNM